jgi:putative flippase GtrA/GT2 family glycosyltransferase
MPSCSGIRGRETDGFLGGQGLVERKEEEAPFRLDQPKGIGVSADDAIHTEPAASSQRVALHEIEDLSADREGGYAADRGYPPDFASPGTEPPVSMDEVELLDRALDPAGGRPASRSRGGSLLRRHGARFASFSVIGGGIFVAGLLLQAVLTSGLHVSSLVSYLVQAVASVEASYFLNRWFTWRNARAAFWSSFLRFNLQKVVTISANLILYGLLLKLGVEYLLDNVLLTVAFTFVNYISADRLVFLRGGPRMTPSVPGPFPVIAQPSPALPPVRQPDDASQRAGREMPSVSVVIPVRANEKTIRAAVVSVLSQDYPLLRELLLVGSPDDSTWAALRDIDDPRLRIRETPTPPGIRDANFKRDFGIRETSGDLVSLIDSDMVIPANWMSNAVRLLMENEVDCVAGIMRSIRYDFWGRFVDGNRLSAKTPRAERAYLVTAEEFGVAGSKPPITADILFTREVYEDCPINSSWSHGSLEDYEWYWRVVKSGHKVLVSSQLYGWHHHRAGFKSLSAEYRRSARGCAYFIRAHRDSPFARKRMAQAVTLPIAALAVVAGLAVAAATGHGLMAVAVAAAVAAAGVLLLSAREFDSARTVESLVYPVPALALGVNYTASLVSHLIRGALAGSASTVPREKDSAGNPSVGRRVISWLLHPLTFVLALQAGLSLSIVWSNTAYGDEALYLWEGHLEWRHWLHGTPLPVFHDSGAPQFYPVIGALADKLAGLAGARILSMLFMLAASALLFSIGEKLFGTVAASAGTALWAVSEPVLRLTYATYDPLGCLLVIGSVYLAMRSAYATRKAELVLASGVCLGLGCVTAESFAIMIPAVVVVSFFLFQSTDGTTSAFWCAGWQGGISIVVTAGLFTVLHLWKDAIGSTITRSNSSASLGQGLSLVLRAAWSWDSLIFGFAIAGAVIAFRAGRGALVLSLALSIVLVPAYQAHLGTAASMDKHISAGSGLAALAAGYGISRLRPMMSLSRLNWIFAIVALISVPAVTGIWYARATFHDWPNLTRLIAVSRQFNPNAPVLVNSENGNFTIHLFTYYLTRYNWVNNNSQEYAEIAAGGYDGVLQDLDASQLASAGLATSALNSETNLDNEVLALATGNDLDRAIESSHHYVIAEVIPYVTSSSSDSSGVFVVWRRSA